MHKDVCIDKQKNNMSMDIETQLIKLSPKVIAICLFFKIYFFVYETCVVELLSNSISDQTHGTHA